jgi:LCP family protein required for cell wall assembly
MSLFRRNKDSSGTARYSDVFRSARRRERKHMRHRWQWILLGIFLLLAGLAGYGVYYYYSLQADIQHPTGGITDLEGPDVVEEKPFNVLLVGSDSREGLTPQQQLDLGAGTEGVSGQRADTLILAHIDPSTDDVIMVQFPRDLWVPLAGGEKGKINAALQSGRTAVVKTVSELTGLDINNYVQINIAGFRDMVNAIDGVDVCVPEPIPFDPNTGIEVKPEEVGMVHFDGNRALRFVRSRHSAATGSDFARIQNQQKFIAAALDKVLSTGTFFQPGRIRALADVARRNLEVDQYTTITDLVDIGRKLENFNPERYEAYTAPNYGARTIAVDGADVSIVAPDYRSMEVMFDALARDRSPAASDGVPGIAPSTIAVGVYNGVGLDRLVAKPAARDLEAATDVNGGPVDVRAIANAPNFHFKKTVIRWNATRPETQKMAELVAAALPRATVEQGKVPKGLDVAVIVGRGKFEAEKITQILPIPIPKPGALPEVCRQDSAN